MTKTRRFKIGSATVYVTRTSAAGKWDVIAQIPGEDVVFTVEAATFKAAAQAAALRVRS
jgi:hypothetical protein